jgi:hypothetical protein
MRTDRVGPPRTHTSAVMKCPEMPTGKSAMSRNAVPGQAITCARSIAWDPMDRAVARGYYSRQLPSTSEVVQRIAHPGGAEPDPSLGLRPQSGSSASRVRLPAARTRSRTRWSHRSSMNDFIHWSIGQARTPPRAAARRPRLRCPGPGVQALRTDHTLASAFCAERRRDHGGTRQRGCRCLLESADES